MKSTAILGLVGGLLIVMPYVVTGCSDDEVSNNNTRADGGATNDGSGTSDGPLGARDGTTGTPAPFGLDSRPANTTCTAPARPSGNSPVSFTRMFGTTSFSDPVGMLQAPGDSDHFYVVEKGGIVKLLTRTGTTSTTFINITSRVNSNYNEAGLLGMAFHPNFASNHYVYLSYTTFGGGPVDLRSVIRRYTASNDGLTADPATEVPIFGPLNQPYENHNGGWIAFGPEGNLYLGLGDGGSGNDPQNNGQNTNVFLGKMLRFDVDSATPYAIPATNPFANDDPNTHKREIYAWGLRNPWRFSFDKATGELWAGDVGQDTREEIDKIQVGGNYGWKIREGMICRPPTTGCTKSGLIDPVLDYPQTQGNGSVTGGFVYRGTAIPSLVGTYLYADFLTGRIWGLFYDTDGKPAPQQLNSGGPSMNVSSFAEENSGELYVIDYNGPIYKIAAATGGPVVEFPDKLSKTGCVDANNPKQPAAGLIPYNVNAPLWSDGADKDRWLAIPDGTQIHIDDEGDFDLPIGSVLVKTFSIGGKRIETRLLVRHDDGGWAGYTYEWDDGETDATLLPSSETKTVGSQEWYFPSRAECLRCHTEAAGRSLGLEIGQLNGDFTYPNGRLSNQLATFDHIGLFDGALSGEPSTLTVYPWLDSSASVEARAKAYLHGNCSHCHQPNGNGGGPIDLRFSTSVADSKTCGTTPENGDLGISGGKTITPGNPETSILSHRIHSLDVTRMPPLASRVVDTSGAQVVDDWIRSLTACP